MAEDNTQRGNIYSANDTLDINELASLNEDISPEFIEQLQNKVSQNASEFTGKPIIQTKDDTELFEEVSSQAENEHRQKVNIDENIDDNFMKKYKAKLNKQQLKEFEQISKENQETSQEIPKESATNEIQKTETKQAQQDKNEARVSNKKNEVSNKNDKDSEHTINISTELPTNNEIEELTSGNIIEKPIEQAQIEYNESLDFLDENVKYSKYVIYIDPENKDFMESLTVKERKNLINKIIREQDDITLTKKKLSMLQTVLKHTFIAVITVAIAVPILYWTINASLEASINNYRRSQTIFKTLYKEKGKIKKAPQSY